MIHIDGITFEAPGFTEATFRQAVTRALAEKLYIGPTAKARTVAVHNPTSGMTYLVTRESCTCRAAHHGRACKHRALALYRFEVEGRDITRQFQPDRTDRAASIARRTA